MAAPALPLWRRLRRRGYWLLALGCLTVLERLSPGGRRRFGRGLARLACRLRRRDTAIARANIALVFPDATPAWRADLLARATDRLGENLADAVAAPGLLAGEVAVTEENLDPADGRGLGEILAELAAPGRGVILLTGHLGCWELLGGWLAGVLAARGLGPLGVVTGTVRNPAVDRLVQGRRRRLGLAILPRERGVAPVLRHLRAGGVVAALLDQNTDASSRPVPFCGHPAPTAVGPARIARRGGVPILPVAIGREPGGSGHRVVHLPSLDPDAGSEEDLLAACNAQLERLIRRNPAEWVWFHDRWG